MAAPMSRICRRSFSGFHWLIPRRNSSSAYYVLLPEVPPDDPETNPVMRIDEYPRFKEITPDNTLTGTVKLALNYEVKLGQHLDKLKDPTVKKTFSSVFHPIEQIGVPLNSAWRTAKHLNYVRGSDAARRAFQRVHPRVERAKNERWISEALYNSVKEVNADRSLLNECQQSLLDLYLLESRLNGIELDGNDRKRFIDTLRKLSEERNHFRSKVMLSGNLFSHAIDDFGIVNEYPKHILNLMAKDKQNPSRGPWMVTLQPLVYQSCMEYCSDRALRWNVWHAYNNRASTQHSDRNLTNHQTIREITTLRSDVAMLLGYDNYAEMSMETKMAGSVENVLSMIETFKNKFRPVAEADLARLQEFATSEGFQHQIQMWDVGYWRRRHVQSLYDVKWEEVSQHFPLSRVLASIAELTNQLFGISILECTGEVETWNDDVRFFKVFSEEGSHVASFYYDAFARSDEKINGSWMEPGRERSKQMGTTPYSYLNMNIRRPSPGMPCLLSLDEVITVYREIGHGLQQLLTTVPYSELAGQRNIEWDALHICANFMEMMLLRPETLKSLSGHYSSGQALTDDAITRMLAARNYMSSFDTMRQLYHSALDMEMHVSMKNHWHECMNRLWPEFIPIKKSDNDNHPCSFIQIFSDQFPAAYYSHKWAEMIAADVFGAFEEAGFDDQTKVAALGRRFANTFLSLGGSVPASEVFRRFRGRDPSLDAYLAHKNIGVE